jgi:seryl-tRNA synthetase
MLDIKLIRENPELIRQALEKRGNTFALENILEIDERYRRLLRQVEQFRAQHNEVSKQLGKAEEKPPQIIAEMRQLGEKTSSLQRETSQVKANLDSLLLELPNIPHPSVPLGRDESDNSWPGRESR